MNSICKAKRADNHEWVTGHHVHDEKDYILENLAMRVRGTAELINAPVVESDTISRYSGYKDKSERPIYENDIISWLNGFKYIVRYGYFDGPVGLGYYYGLGFYFERVGHPEHRVPFNIMFLYEYEVLGNLFDNKELLKIEE